MSVAREAMMERQYGRRRMVVIAAIDPTVRCAEYRGPRSRTGCEMPKGHDGWHTGRSPSGRWFSWAPQGDGTGGTDS